MYSKRCPPSLASDARFEEIGIKRELFNIDSRFRKNTRIASTNYQHQFQSTIYHVVSIQISSVELPNSYPFISSTMGTNSFEICYSGDKINVSIPTGNYTSTQLITAITQSLVNSGKGDWEITLDEITGKITITEINGTPFQMFFDKGNTLPKRTRDFGLGSILGFREKTYTSSSTYTSEAPINLYGDAYLLICVNDYDLINTRSREKEVYTALAKVIVDSPKNNYVFDNRNFITKRYVFSQPVDIRTLNIRVLNPNGDIVDFGEQDWSMTVEMEIIENSRLYEMYRNHRLA